MPPIPVPLPSLCPPPPPRPRGRFAPSPTGLLHLGNARTALLAWLQVRSAGGTMVLRMEDLDPARSRPELAVQILADLRWLGLDWDEGPGRPGPWAPYLQSRRADLYREALAQLAAAGHTYRCYCSRAEVARAAGAPHPGEEGPRYPGTCRRLSPAAAARQAAAGRQPAWRFRVEPGPVSFPDLLAGPQAPDPARAGDFVIWRADGVAAYQLAVAVDDAAMGITHVLRGDDLLDSTPRQILLLRALGARIPAYAHAPLLLGPDGSRLSKRHGAVTIAGLRRDGARPEAIIGYLAALSGLVPAGTRAAPRDLIPAWAPARVPRTPALVTPGALAALTGR